MVKNSIETSGSNTQSGTYDFKSAEIVEKIWERARKAGESLADLPGGAAADKAFKTWLREFISIWDFPEALEDEFDGECDGLKVWRRWRQLLLHHASTCEDETKTLEDVARSVFEGRGFRGNGNLGGNPFFDVVLATAAASSQAKAWETFDAMFKERMVRFIGRKLICKSESAGDWYETFKAVILDKGLLNKYRGYSGLELYLKRTAVDCLKSLTLISTKKRKSDDAKRPSVLSAFKKYVSKKEGVLIPYYDPSDDQWMFDTVEKALVKLDPLTRRILRYRLERRARREVAAICNVSVYVVDDRFKEGKDAIVNAIRSLDQKSQTLFYQRLTNLNCCVLSASIQKINFETGELN